MLISIKELTSTAKTRGFRTGAEGEHYVELYAPNHDGPDAVNHYGSIYSCCDIVLSDRPCSGYGYNSFFHGPWHDGMTQDTSHGVQKLVALLG